MKRSANIVGARIFIAEAIHHPLDPDVVGSYLHQFSGNRAIEFRLGYLGVRIGRDAVQREEFKYSVELFSDAPRRNLGERLERRSADKFRKASGVLELLLELFNRAEPVRLKLRRKFRFSFPNVSTEPFLQPLSFASFSAR